MAAAVLHAQKLGLALVELVVADGGDLEAHGGEGFDAGLIVEQRRQQRARADQVAGGHEYAVLLVRAQLLDERRHVLGPAGGDGDLLGLVLWVGDGDTARRRPEVAVKIVDGQDRDDHVRRWRRGRWRAIESE